MNGRILAIDPGPKESAWVIYDLVHAKPLRFGKQLNEDVLRVVAAPQLAQYFAIEKVASYGMSVGAEVFETCVWTGKFLDRWVTARGRHAKDPIELYRLDVKMHICQDSRAKDTNIRQALIDRYGGKEKALGRKADPGPLYGISKDVWSALGIAITAAERRGHRER